MGARLSTECTELAESHGLGLWVTAGRVLRAIFDAELGDPEQADRDFTRAIRGYEHGLGARHMVPLVRTEFARQMVRTGRLDRARSELEWARVLPSKTRRAWPRQSASVCSVSYWRPRGMSTERGGDGHCPRRAAR